MSTTIPKWRKAKASGDNGGQCVELADLGPDIVGVRDSKHPDTGHLEFSRSELKAFLEGVRAGEFDDLQ